MGRPNTPPPEDVVRSRIEGLQLECDLLAADIELRKDGSVREFAYAPNGQRVDISELWLAHQRATLALKRSTLRKLREKFAQMLVTDPPSGQTSRTEGAD